MSVPTVLEKILARKAEEVADWQLAFRFLNGRQYRLSRIAKCNRLQLAYAEVDLAA